MDSFYAPDLADLYFALEDSKNPLHFLFRNNLDFLALASYLNQCGFSRSKNQTGIWIPVLDPSNTEIIMCYKCSVCGRREATKEPFCNCGSKMKAE